MPLEFVYTKSLPEVYKNTVILVICVIGGWSGKSVGEGDGDGFKMGQTQAHLILTTSRGD